MAEDAKLQEYIASKRSTITAEHRRKMLDVQKAAQACRERCAKRWPTWPACLPLVPTAEHLEEMVILHGEVILGELLEVFGTRWEADLASFLNFA